MSWLVGEKTSSGRVIENAEMDYQNDYYSKGGNMIWPNHVLHIIP